MPNTADRGRANPVCLLFVIEHSGSMTGALAGQPSQRKMNLAADAIRSAVGLGD